MVYDFHEQRLVSKNLVESFHSPSKPLVLVSKPDGLVMYVSIYFQLKAADGKLGEELTMRTGAACFSCNHYLDDMQDPEVISQ